MKKRLLASLKTHFRMTKNHWSRFSRRPSAALNHNQAIVILATPSFSKWLEDDISFIPALLEAVTRNSPDPWAITKLKNTDMLNIPQGPVGPPFEIDVVCACVDGLAPDITNMQGERGQHHKEGFSFLHGRTDQIVPGLWEVGLTTEGNPDLQSTLTFSGVQRSDLVSKGKRSSTSEITLPLANTLFANGRHSTLLASRWRLSPNKLFTKLRSTEKRNQVVNVFEDKYAGIPPSHIPAIPLTPVRRIVSGLGNIVRQLHFAAEGPGPASRELEANVTEYLRVIQRPNTTVSVWALITPLESLPDAPPEPPFDILTNQDAVKQFWREGIPNTKFIGHWLERGATLCRVRTSGPFSFIP